MLEDFTAETPLNDLVETIAEITNETPPSINMTVTTASAELGVSILAGAPPTTATLGAGISGNSGQIGYGFYWGTDSTPDNRVSVGVTDSSSHSFTFDLENLDPNTTYYFRAFAGASRGEVLSFNPSEPNVTEPLPMPHALHFDGDYWYWGWGYEVYHDFRNEDILEVRAFFVDADGNELHMPGVEIEYTMHGETTVQNTTGEFSTWEIGRDNEALVEARVTINGVLFSAEAPIYVVRVPLRQAEE